MAKFIINLTGTVEQSYQLFYLLVGLARFFSDVKVQGVIEVETDNQLLIPILHVLSLDVEKKEGSDEDLLGMGVS